MQHYLRSSDSNRVYSIGSEIIDHPYGPEFTAGGIRDLRYYTFALRNSDHPNDKDGVRDINNAFITHDHKFATRHLNHRLQEPIGKNILEWLCHAPDHDIAQFCRWSFERTQRLTQALRRDQPDFITQTLDMASELVDSGLFPPYAISVIESATQTFTLHGMDTFYRGGMNAVGFCGPETIALANRYRFPQQMHSASNGMKKTMFHEYLHGAGKDRGFFWGLKTPLRVERILEEAFVQHSAVVAFSPSFSKKPFQAHRDKLYFSGSYNTVYHAERTFMSSLVEHADISLEHLSEAYFLPRGSERGEWLREDIERKIGHFFGSRYAFFAFVNEYETTPQSDRPALVLGKIKELTKPFVT